MSSCTRAYWKLAIVAILAAGGGGCATVYVDNTLGDTPPSAYHRPATPQPAQVLFVFKSKGTDNVRATTQLRKDVLDTVQQSGLFSAIGPDPVPAGTLLSIVVDNVPVTSESEAMAKGFATGLTFGLAGSEVTDGYICTIDYIPAAGGAKITVTEHHALHATIGAHGAPANSTRAPSIKEGVKIMLHQILAAGLKDLSLNPGFGN
jgi:hypothetical protein